MDNIIIISIIVLILGLSFYYVIKAKKNDRKCIGCPYKDSCTSKNVSCTQDKNSL